MAIEMPEGTHLAYIVYHETYWWQQLREESRPVGGRRSVNVTASAKGQGGGVAWEFFIVEYHLSGPALKLEIFDDGWVAFATLSPLFAAMASGEIETLDDVRTVLDGMGAVDETERPGVAPESRSPYRPNRVEALREALNGLWVTEAGSGDAVRLDVVLDRLDAAGLLGAEG